MAYVGSGVGQQEARRWMEGGPADGEEDSRRRGGGEHRGLDCLNWDFLITNLLEPASQLSDLCIVNHPSVRRLPPPKPHTDVCVRSILWAHRPPTPQLPRCVSASLIPPSPSLSLSQSLAHFPGSQRLIIKLVRIQGHCLPCLSGRA